MQTGRHGQHGAVFMAMLVTVAVVAVMLMEVGTLWSSVLQRERESQLLARGDEIRRAIGLYYSAGTPTPRPWKTWCSIAANPRSSATCAKSMTTR